jgi:hypothetical protein
MTAIPARRALGECSAQSRWYQNSEPHVRPASGLRPQAVRFQPIVSGCSTFSSPYRQLARLRAASILRVVGERRARGANERT